MKYIVDVFYTSIIKETWEVEAISPEDARMKAQTHDGRLSYERTMSAELIPDCTEVEVEE